MKVKVFVFWFCFWVIFRSAQGTLLVLYSKDIVVSGIKTRLPIRRVWAQPFELVSGPKQRIDIHSLFILTLLASLRNGMNMFVFCFSSTYGLVLAQIKDHFQ